MFWTRCRAPACRPCGAAAPSAADVVKVDLSKFQHKSAARDIVAEVEACKEAKHASPAEEPPAALEKASGALAQFKEVAREWLGQLADVALEYPYEELAAATDGFAPGRCLGAGGAGAVFRGRLRGGTEVAVKVLADLGGLEGFEDEVRVLSKFRHPNLVTLYGWGQHEKTKYIIYELLPGGDLQGRLRSRKEGDPPFTWQERLRVATGAANGLSHMMNNQPKAFHRDIKPPNILIDADGSAKMADFGLAAVLQGDMEDSEDSHLAVDQVSGTPGYMCPTYMQTGRVTEQSEAYSFGIVLLELLVNRPPALVTSHGDLVFPLMEALRPAAAGAHSRILSQLDQSARWQSPIVDGFADLALACVDLAPARRPSFKVILDTLRYLTQCAACNQGVPSVPVQVPQQRQAAEVPPAAPSPWPAPARAATRGTGKGSSDGIQEDAASTSDGECSCGDSEVASGDEADSMPATEDRSRNFRLWWR